MASRDVTVWMGYGVLLLAAAGCGDLFGGSDLELTVEVSDTLVGPDRTSSITLSATNSGDAVAWGQGSSSCQLTAVVRVDGDDYPIDVRPCTDDLVLQGVGHGMTLTEAFSWNAEYVVGGKLDTLDAGRYQLYALAGAKARSRAQAVRVGR